MWSKRGLSRGGHMGRAGRVGPRYVTVVQSRHGTSHTVHRLGQHGTKARAILGLHPWYDGPASTNIVGLCQAQHEAGTACWACVRRDREPEMASWRGKKGRNLADGKSAREEEGGLARHGGPCLARHASSEYSCYGLFWPDGPCPARHDPFGLFSP